MCLSWHCMCPCFAVSKAIKLIKCKYMVCNYLIRTIIVLDSSTNMWVGVGEGVPDNQ